MYWTVNVETVLTQAGPQERVQPFQSTDGLLSPSRMSSPEV